MCTRWLSTLTCAVVLVTLNSYAQAVEKPARPDRFMSFDTDGDGKVSFTEAKVAFPNLTQEAFNERDRNEDGFWTIEDRRIRKDSVMPNITGAPLLNGPGAMTGSGPKSRLLKMDTDGDSKVSLSEAQAANPELTEAMFKKRDHDGDGYWSSADWRSAFTHGRMQRPGTKMAAMDTDGDSKISLAEAQAARPNLTEELFKERDRNNDGFWSAEDLPTATPQTAPVTDRKALLSRMDTDGDSKITLAEVQAARPGITEEMFKLRDRNGDGFWSAEDRVKPSKIDSSSVSPTPTAAE